MTRILVAGLCPLPLERARKTLGPGMRSWQLAAGLARTGHEVHLVAMMIPGAYDHEPSRREDHEGIRIERVDDKEFFDLGSMIRRIGDLRPDALVGATAYGSYVLARTEPRVPFWADQFGHFMAEAQAKAQLEGANWPVARFYRHLEPVLRTADKISTVSRRQRYAAVGELGLVGRLTAETCGYEMTAVMPCALMPPQEAVIRPMLRPRRIPREALVVFWSGGYNVWSDVDTLFRGLDSAMAQEPAIHFVSTGGEIGGHDVRTYDLFQKLVAGSRFRDRYHLLGWIASEDVPSHLAEADLGVLTDRPMYEGRLGHKNRIVQWMGAGLPVAYNDVGDLGEELRTHELAFVFDSGDAEALARSILSAARDRSLLREMAERAKLYALERFTIEATTRELAAWADNPAYAPDRDLRRRTFGPADFDDQAPGLPAPVGDLGTANETAVLRRVRQLEVHCRELRRQLDDLAMVADRRVRAAEDRVIETDSRVHELGRRLGEIHNSKMWRAWMTYLAVRRWITAPFGRREDRP